MTGTPLLFQLHTVAALALVAIRSFTRLVHAWAVPAAVYGQPTLTTRRVLQTQRPCRMTLLRPRSMAANSP